MKTKAWRKEKIMLCVLCTDLGHHPAWEGLRAHSSLILAFQYSQFINLTVVLSFYVQRTGAAKAASILENGVADISPSW